MVNRTLLFLLGILLSATLSAQTIQYDKLGKVTQIKYENGTLIDYTYDAGGNRESHQITGVCHTYSATQTASICNSESYILPNGESVNASGTYIDTLATANGCDSIITTHLTAFSLEETSVSKTLCKNESYTLPDGEIVSEGGTYRDTLSTIHGCDSVVVTNLAVIQLDTSVVFNEQTLTSNQDDAIYLWLNCDENTSITTEIAQSFTPGESGTYSVRIEKDGCVDTSNCYTIEISDIENLHFGNKIKTFPVPVKKQVYIDLGKEYRDIFIEIQDIEGKILGQKHFENKHLVDLDMSKYPHGIYVLKMQIEGQQKSVKIVKE
jgi:YD repeat-containing protein